MTRPRKNYVDRSTWEYEFDEQGMAKVDETLQDPRCAINLLKAHVERYTPEMVERICGTPKDKFLKVCELIATTANGERSMTSLYALGWTQHTTGAQNIRSMAMIQLLLGNMGIPGGGVNALRGHSNVQGITDFALLSTSTPGYLVLPTEQETTYADYMKSRGLQADPSWPDQLLAELREVLRQPAEESLRRRGDQGERLGLRLPAQVRHGLRRAEDGRHDGGAAR